MTGEISTDDFQTIISQFTERGKRYCNAAATEAQLPQELKTAVSGGEWPNEHADPVKLRTKRLGMGMRIKNVKNVTAEEIADGSFPLNRFDYLKRMFELAIEFGEIPNFKDLLVERLATAGKPVEGDDNK